MAQLTLSDRRIFTASPGPKPYRLFDRRGLGLALLISPTGVKSWQLRYRLNNKPQTATLGKYPRMGLAEAREAARAARKVAAQGEHLTTAKRLARLRKKADLAVIFKNFAEAWTSREARRAGWTTDYTEEVRASIRNHLSVLDALPLVRIDAAIAAPVLLGIELRTPHMLEKVRRRLRAILDDAVEQGILPANPLPVGRRRKRLERRHYPAITDLPELGAILRAARAADPSKAVARAHLLLAFTAQRVSEVTGARWSEFELDGVDVPLAEAHRMRRDPAAGDWSIPRERMKRKDPDRGPHVVPLPPALLAALREWRAADGPEAEFVCPNPRDRSRPITPEGMEKFYRRALGLAGKHSPHSWRAAFSTVAREAGKHPDIIEAQLDHVVGNKVAAAYDRAKRLQLRRELMQWYEQRLIAARDGAAVMPIRAAGT